MALASYPFTNVRMIDTQEDFDENLEKIKIENSSQWLQIVGVLTRLAKTKLKLFRDFKANSIDAKQMKNLIETHVAGEVTEIPSFFKINKKGKK